MASDLMADLESQMADTEPLIDEPVPEALHRQLERFALLELKRRELESLQKKLADRINALREPLWESMCEAGMTNANVHGLRLYGQRSIVVNKKPEKEGVTTQMVCEALRKIGRGDMVADGYSGSSLKSLVVERLKEDQPIPEELVPLLNVFEKTVLTSGL